ncbi:MAG: hypothetical protein EP338_02995 [Bacteroidetes bacterium]|nr:MAG: hypothetical protein EP338_02995 [Bacteroidota bacterium]
MNSEEGPAYSEVLEFLSSLKNSDSKKVVIACLRDRKYEDCRQQILSSIWNSPLDYSEYLSDFVRAAVSYDYMDSLESLTIIENLDGPFEEKEVLESQLLLRDYHEGKFSKSREKDQLVSEVALFIKSFNEHLDDFDDFELLEEED